MFRYPKDSVTELLSPGTEPLAQQPACATTFQESATKSKLSVTVSDRVTSACRRRLRTGARGVSVQLSCDSTGPRPCSMHHSMHIRPGPARLMLVQLPHHQCPGDSMIAAEKIFQDWPPWHGALMVEAWSTLAARSTSFEKHCTTE
jgi:hypothetical protein